MYCNDCARRHAAVLLFAKLRIFCRVCVSAARRIIIFVDPFPFLLQGIIPKFALFRGEACSTFCRSKSLNQGDKLLSINHACGVIYLTACISVPAFRSSCNSANTPIGHGTCARVTIACRLRTKRRVTLSSASGTFPANGAVASRRSTFDLWQG